MLNTISQSSVSSTIEISQIISKGLKPKDFLYSHSKSQLLAKLVKVCNAVKMASLQPSINKTTKAQTLSYVKAHKSLPDRIER